MTEIIWTTNQVKSGKIVWLDEEQTKKGVVQSSVDLQWFDVTTKGMFYTTIEVLQ